uniref:palmdelphin-like isoform X1 n=1 Tax=Solea senegalensis TaxID=28829 RepID=UPI001CD8FAC0|nr:palmdelphin-like isoform X1 [Solea senegalensis]XP_043903169.1 palmdelphin-like isoform X1 [Solea senegalensis]
MDECNLLKERLQAITEKHRIQEDIRQKKLELDREKLKLQHLKKKAMREQWLLQDSTTHNATSQQQSLLSDQQQTRALQLNIHGMEKEVEFLEREESMISTNESFILNRLKAVEKSSQEIIKEANENFVPKPSRVAMVIPDDPESPSPLANNHTELTPRKMLFAMEINVTKNLLTGENTVLSTATVPPEDLHQHSGLKVYDDGRKCIYTLNPQEGSHDPACVSELSAREVQQLLRSATAHRQLNHQHPSIREEQWRSKRHDNEDKVEVCDLSDHRGRCGNHVLLHNTTAEKDVSCVENWQNWREYQENPHSRQDERLNHSKLRERHRLGNGKEVGFHHGDQKGHGCSSYQVRNCHSVLDNRPVSNSSIIRSNSTHGGRTNGWAPPRSHDQEVVSPYQSQLCYTPANHIPLSDYISVDEEELYCNNPPSYQSALYRGPTPSERVPSPLYGDDTPYTILNTMDTTEPITAIFMGFQTAQDDSGWGQEFEGSLKAELVVIEDSDENGEDNNSVSEERHAQPSVSGFSTGSSANGNVGFGVKRTAPGIKRTQKKHQPCCCVS